MKNYPVFPALFMGNPFSNESVMRVHYQGPNDVVWLYVNTGLSQGTGAYCVGGNNNEQQSKFTKS